MSILYLVYRRLRPSLGIPFGFILMYGMYTGTVTPVLLMAATGFFLMHLFGDTYNDYCDYEEDRLNKRDDKLITRGVLTRKDVKIVSIVSVLANLAVVWSLPFVLVSLLLASLISSLAAGASIWIFAPSFWLLWLIKKVALFFAVFNACCAGCNIMEMDL